MHVHYQRKQFSAHNMLTTCSQYPQQVMSLQVVAGRHLSLQLYTNRPIGFNHWFGEPWCMTSTLMTPMHVTCQLSTGTSTVNDWAAQWKTAKSFINYSLEHHPSCLDRVTCYYHQYWLLIVHIRSDYWFDVLMHYSEGLMLLFHCAAHRTHCDLSQHVAGRPTSCSGPIQWGEVHPTPPPVLTGTLKR